MGVCWELWYCIPSLHIHHGRKAPGEAPGWVHIALLQGILSRFNGKSMESLAQSLETMRDSRCDGHVVYGYSTADNTSQGGKGKLASPGLTVVSCRTNQIVIQKSISLSSR